MKFDHVAINVKEIRRSVEWYEATLQAKLLYEDDTWALLEVGGLKLALTVPREHPGHIAFDVGEKLPPGFASEATLHRDGSVSKYFTDPDGNVIEWINYPKQKTE